MTMKPDKAGSSARSAMMLDESVANLNTGSFGPLPRVVFERVTELRRRLAEEPMDFLAPPDAAAAVAGPASGWPSSSAATRAGWSSPPTSPPPINIVAVGLRLAAPARSC